MLVKVCLDDTAYYNKNSAKRNAAKISQRIADKETEIELHDFVYEAGENGRCYAPALFNGTRKIENFRQMQIFCLDFDSGRLTFDEIRTRCNEIKLPIAFGYETLSSSDTLRKYRIGFIHIEPVTNADVALFILRILIKMFPELDASCAETARMYFGGKAVCYYDDSEPVLIVDDFARNYQYYMKAHDNKHFVEKQKEIVKNLNILGLIET